MTNSSNTPAGPPVISKEVQVMLVDDEADMLDVIADAFKERGLSCFCASSGEQAIEGFRNLNPKIIITDYNMPGLNGLELFRMLRDLGNRAPVIWLTGDATPEITREAWMRGVLSIFQKPFELDELVDNCQQYLKMTPEELVQLRPKFITNKMFQNVSIDIDTPLYEKLKKKCIESSTSISRYISELLDKSLS